MFHFHRPPALRLASAAVAVRHCTQSIDVLPLCATAQSLSATKQAHAIAITHGRLPSSLSISAALILSYASHDAHPSIPQFLFNQTAAHARSPFLHNTFIRACTCLSAGPHSKSAIHLGISTYNDLLSDSRFFPDDHTFPFVLKLCADHLNSSKGQEVHGRLIKAGFDTDVFVNNTLMLLYGSCGDLTGAHKVFDEMPERDLITWNTGIRLFSDNQCLLQSINLFMDMISIPEFIPNVATIVTILPVCAELEDVNLVALIHCHVYKAGLNNEVRIGNALVDAYGKCGHVETMKKVFDEMIERSDVSWNSIISGFSCNGFDGKAVSCFKEMIRNQVEVNTVTIAIMLPTLLELNMFDKGREVHGYSIKMGMDLDGFVANALLDMYGKWGRSVQASYLFDKMGKQGIVSWNTMIGNLAQNGCELEAIHFVREMQRHGEAPNIVTLINILPACARLSSLRLGKEIHAYSMKSISSSDLFVSNALTDMYAKCGCLDLARTLFAISPKDEVSYNILITGYSQTSECLNSITLFTEMESLGLLHDIISYVGVLSACANGQAIKEGKQIHARAVRTSFHDHIFVANSLLDMYIKCGRIDTSMSIFTQIRDKDTTSWNTMILGLGMLGEFNKAIDLFEAMKDDGVKQDSISYIAVLSACSHGGLVEKGKTYFSRLVAQSIEPSEMHYACMVDLLGRSGLMLEAMELINAIPPGKAGANIWGALLGASRVHGNVEVGCLAAERLLEIRPNQPGYYVVLSNMYAEAGKWDEADRVRKLMIRRGVKKNPGCSWVQVQDEVHGLIAGESLNLQLWQATVSDTGRSHRVQVARSHM